MNFLLKVEANQKIGLGHIKRIESIHYNLKKLSANSFISSNAVNLVNKKFESSIINSNYYKSYEEEIIKNKNIDHVVLDISHSENLLNPQKINNYIEFLNSKNIDYSLIDGLGDDRISRKIKLRNCKNYFLPYIGSENINFPYEFFKNKYSGAKYSPINLVFNKYLFEKKNVEIPKRLLITCGGSDENSITEKILQLINKNENLINKIKIQVIIGPFFKEKLIQRLYKNFNNPNIEFLRNKKSLLKIYQNQDLIITTTGTTRYECLALNLPFLYFSYKVPSNSEMLISFNSILKKSYLGDLSYSNIDKDYFYNFFNSKIQFKELKKSCENKIDLLGAKRIAKALLKLN